MLTKILYLKKEDFAKRGDFFHQEVNLVIYFMDD